MSTLSYFRPPVVLPKREEEYTCEICGRTRWGAPGQKVCTGRCRQEQSRRNAARTAERNRQKKRLQQAAAC